MRDSGSILEKLVEGRIPVFSRIAASTTADSILIAEFSPIESLDRHASTVIDHVENAEGIVAVSEDGVLVAAFSGPSAAVRLAVRLQQKRPRHSSIRIGIYSASGGGINQKSLTQAVALVRSAKHGQILVNASARNAALFDTGVKCTWMRNDAAEVHWQELAVEKFESIETAPLFVPAKPQLPSVISDRFEILGEVGDGGMGIVYKARDLEAGEIVALKVLRPEIAANASMMRRFKNEMSLARKITHKNVCRIYDLNRFETTYFISMEFVEGETLRAVLKRFGALGMRKGLEVAQQLCAGLREAHARGVVHRDLKPENIMFDREGNVRIMDFGIARSVENQATTMAIVGTPAYMAPEQAQGQAVDHRADIYSLGLILYEIFTGAIPFTGDTPLAIAMKQVSERPVPPKAIDPSLPNHVEAVILRCIEKNPAKRFQSVDEIEQALMEKGFWTPAPRKLTAQDRAPQMVQWQQSDWILLLCAAVASLVIMALFSRVYPLGTTPLGQLAPPRRVLFIGPAFLAFILLMFVRRKLYRQEPVPSTLRVAAVIGLGAAAAIPITEYEGPGAMAFKIGMPMLSFFVTFVVVHCVITTVLHYGHRRLPDQIAGYQIFFTERLLSPPVGLEMVRGILAGLVFVGAWLSLMWMISPAGAVFVALPYWMGSYLYNFFPILIFVETLLVTWILVAFPITVFAGGSKRLPVLLAALATLWIVLGFSLVGAMVLPAVGFEVAAAFQAAFLGYVFLKYGISAVGSSILTIEVFLLALPLFRIFEGSRPWQHAVPLSVWAVMFAGSVLILLRPQINAGYRRVIAMLE